MPTLELIINVEIVEQAKFALEFAKIGAKALGKPEALMSTIVSFNNSLTFAGTLDPTFALTVTSLDNLNPEANEKYSAAFAEFIENKLGIPKDRGYITFQDPGRGYIGWKGTTFASLWGQS